ncbi:MAG: RNA ligase [Candidatus Micrarchaeia archaeon]
MDPKKIAMGLKKGRIELQKGEVEYYRFKDGFAGIERGTVVCGSRIIRGFPHIRRIFSLGKGVKRNMGDCVLYAEEKIDGFNVRIAYISGKIWAFSRGGFLDLFVTEKARGLGLEGFFRETPGYVICAEMIGNTPYTEPAEGFDVKLYVFDVDVGGGTYLPCAAKYELLKKHSIGSAPLLGRFESSDIAGLKKAMLELDKSRKEGMVLKSEDRKKAVKFVTPYSDIEDIAGETRLFYDMPIGFYYQRVLRSAFFIREFGLDREEYARKLGRAFYEGLIAAIRDAEEGLPAAEEFEILIKDLGIWDDLRRHMSREVKVEELWRRAEDGKTRIRFRKIYKKTTKTLTAFAGGKGVMD